MTINKDEAIELAQHLRAEHASESWCWDSLLEAASMIEALAATSHIAPDAAAIQAEGAAIHYPGCWDTAAYPTVNDALSAVYDHFKCGECASAIAPKASELPNGELLTEDQRDRIIAAMAKAWPAGFKDTPYKAMSQLAWNIEQACMVAIAMHRAAAAKPVEVKMKCSYCHSTPKAGSTKCTECGHTEFVPRRPAAAEPVPTPVAPVVAEGHDSAYSIPLEIIGYCTENMRKEFRAAVEKYRAANPIAHLVAGSPAATKPAASEAVGVPEKLAMRDDTFTVIPQNMVEYQMSVREPDNDNDLFRVAFEDACREDKPDGAEETMFAWDFFKYGWLAAIRILAAPAAPTDATSFEAAMRKHYPLFPMERQAQRHGDNEVKYVSAGTQHAWTGWQLYALKSSPQAPNQGEKA